MCLFLMIIFCLCIRIITTMRAGALNETIDIYKPTVIRDEYGNQKTEYVKRLTTRAKVSVNRGTREE